MDNPNVFEISPPGDFDPMGSSNNSNVDDDKTTRRKKGKRELTKAEQALEDSIQPKTKSGEPRYETKEELVKHQSLIGQLHAYGSSPRFGTYLSDQGYDLRPSKLKMKDIKDLENLLLRVRTSVNSKTNSNVYSSMYFAGLKGVETVVCASPALREKFDISGCTEALKGNEDLEDALESMRLENGSMVSMPPHWKIGIITCNALASTAQNNRLKRMISQNPQLQERIRRMRDHVEQERANQAENNNRDPAVDLPDLEETN